MYVERMHIPINRLVLQVDAPEKGQECTDSRGRPYACGLISKDKLLQKVGTQVCRGPEHKSRRPTK